MAVQGLKSYALSTCVAVALLAGCGAPQAPISAPGAVPQAAQGASYSYQVLYFFGGTQTGDGAYPQGRLIDVNGTLYGTTNYGGTLEKGTVYSVATSGVEKVLYSFAGGSDGQNPEAGLTNVNGTLYGTTYSGGSPGDGTVFSISTSGAETVLHSFGSGSDGSHPQAHLLNMKGMLYGTTLGGGSSACKCGAVFSISTGGAEKVLYSFAGGSDGMNPAAGLIEVGGTLYGTTYGGGGTACGHGYGCGTVYKINKAGAEKVLYRFAGNPDGQGPQSGLLDVGSDLYGTTAFGGGTACTARVESRHGDGCGTVYRISLTGAEKVLYSFAGGSDGAIPVAGLVNVGGILYGTTYAGGGNSACGRPSGCGTVYSVSTTGSEKVLHSFARYSDGSRPLASLTNVNGTMYGTTIAGSKNHSRYGAGTVFMFTP
jgi:uncharacterized repeat protein (TIGR03803 family)